MTLSFSKYEDFFGGTVDSIASWGGLYRLDRSDKADLFVISNWIEVESFVGLEPLNFKEGEISLCVSDLVVVLTSPINESVLTEIVDMIRILSSLF